MKVVSYKNLPARLPLNTSITLWLLLDRLQAPQWAWGAVGVFVLLVWISFLYSLCTEKQTEIFPTK